MRWLLAISLAFAAPCSAQDFTTLKGHGGPIMGLAMAESGTLASASFDNSVGLWADGESPAFWLDGHDAAVVALTFTSQGTPISGGDDFAIRIWGETPRILGSHKGKVSALAVAPDGGVLASGSWDGSVALWSLDDGTQTELPYPGAGVNALAFSPNGKLLFVTTSQGLVLRYDLENLKSRPIARHGFGVNKLIVKNDWIAYGAVDGGTRIIDHEGREIADFTLDRRPILSMAHHGPSSQLAVGDGHSYIMMIDTQRWKITKDFRAFRKGPVWALAFSNGGETLYAGGLDSVIYAWPVALLDAFEPAQGETRAFLRDTATMLNGERQFIRKCSICHALTAGASRKAGPSLHGLFGRAAGVLPDYKYSPILANSSIVWNAETIDLLFDEGPDHYIPGSKMPMQVIAKPSDRADLIEFLKGATK